MFRLRLRSWPMTHDPDHKWNIHTFIHTKEHVTYRHIVMSWYIPRPMTYHPDLLTTPPTTVTTTWPPPPPPPHTVPQPPGFDSINIHVKSWNHRPNSNAGCLKQFAMLVVNSVGFCRLCICIGYYNLLCVRPGVASSDHLEFWLGNSHWPLVTCKTCKHHISGGNRVRGYDKTTVDGPIILMT